MRQILRSTMKEDVGIKKYKLVVTSKKVSPILLLRFTSDMAQGFISP